MKVGLHDKLYEVESISSDDFAFLLPLDQPIYILETSLKHVLPADHFEEIKKSENSVIKPGITFINDDIQHQALKILRNDKEMGSEDGLHGRDGGIIGIITLLSDTESNRNITSNSTLKRKRVDAHINNIPIVLIEEKADKSDIEIARTKIKEKFAWAPHY
nr:8616_t:CDS:1 [Entrophospora candida]